MDPANPLQQLLLRGLGTTTLVADRLRGVTQDWVSRGRLDPQQASALVDDVMKALRGETPELEEQMERNLERNRDNLLQDLGVALVAIQAEAKFQNVLPDGLPDGGRPAQEHHPRHPQP